MSVTRRGVLLLVALSVILWVRGVGGQEGSGEAGNPPPLAAPQEAAAGLGGAEAVGPVLPLPPSASGPPILGQARLMDTGVETFYVRDGAGQLVPVVNLPYEELMQLYALRRQLADPALPPGSVVKALTMVGEVREDLLRLEARMEIETLRSGMIRTELRFGGAILDGPVQHEGAGEAVVDVLPQGAGYACWLEGGDRTTHQLVLNFLVPTARVGRETRVRVQLPAVADSALRLRVPDKLATVTAQPATAVFSSRMLGEGGTEWAAKGLRGDVQLAWSEPVADAAPPALIEAFGQLQVQIKGPASLTTQAKFRLTSFGREMQAIRIRLPRSCQPIAIEDAAYTTQFVRAADLDWPTVPVPVEADAPIAVIKFSQPTRGPVDVRLIVEQFPTQEAGAGPMEVMGFEVLGAVRHSGTIQLFTEGDWLIRWDDLSEVRRVVPPNEISANDELVATFEYDRQPASLPVLILTKETRIHVEPTYLFQVESDRVTLTAWLDFRVLGAPTSSLYVDLAGFEVTDIGDANLIREDALRLSRVDPLEIPLSAARRGEFRLEIQARRPIDPQAAIVRLPIPFVQNASAAPAVVVVDPADSVMLKSVLQTLRLFDPEPLPDEVARLVSDRAPLCYRYRGHPADAYLEYEFGTRERSITVRPESLVRWTGDWVEVQQTFSFDVRHQPLDRVRMRLPAELSHSASLTMSLDTQTLSRDHWSPIAEMGSDVVPEGTGSKEDPPMESDRSAAATDGSSAVADSDESRPSLPLMESPGSLPAPPAITVVGDRAARGGSIWDIPLGQPRLGEFVIQARHRFTVVPPESAEHPVTFSVPLAQPVTGECTSVAVRVEAAEATVVQLGDAVSWTATPTLAPSGGEGQVLELTSGGRPVSLPLVARRVQQQGKRPTVMDRAFAQTWLTHHARQDRVAYRMSRVAWPIQIKLPEGVIREELQALIDGDLVEPRWETAHQLRLDAPLTVTEVTRLELIYPFTHRPRPGAMELQLPEVTDASWMRQLYWQLITPGREHVFGGPADLHAEHLWQRQGLIWRRVPLRSQEWLEQWSGASRQLAPSGTANSYLFSSFGQQVQLEIRTTPRHLLLLSGAALVLLAAVAWRLTPAAWRGTALLLTTPILVSAAWLFPQTVCLLGQAVGLGFALWLAAQAIAWYAGSSARTPITATPRPPTSVNVPRPASGDSSLRRLASTQAGAVSPPVPETSASDI